MNLPSSSLLGAVSLTLGLLLTAAPALGFDAEVFKPSKGPELEGPYAINDKLKGLELLAQGELSGPEDIAIDAAGFIYTGTADGTVKKISPDGKVQTFVHLGGRPLGMDFDREGNLIVCEPYSGLWRVSKSGEASLLVDSFQGRKLQLIDDVKVAEDGLIYFSEASSEYNLDRYQLDVLSAQARGQVFRFDPRNGQTELMLDKLYFANGIALEKSSTYLLVAETSRYRISRLWLKGPRAGERDIFLDNLPGFPDTISMAKDGKVWVPYFSVRDQLLDRIHPYPWIKRLLALVPSRWLPKPPAYSFVAAYDENGQVLENLQDPSGERLHSVTSVEEFEGKIYVGSLVDQSIGVLRLNDRKP